MLKEIIDKYKSEKDNGSRTFDLKAELVKLLKTSGNKSPKRKVVTALEYNEEIESLREAILSNLSLNPSFLSNNIDIRYYEPIFKTLSSEIDENDKDLKHKLTCMLHMAKSSLGRNFVKLLSDCTYVTANHINPVLNDEFKELTNKIGIPDIVQFFRTIMDNKNISAKIENLASSISGKPLSTLCTDVKLILFSCPIEGLHSFSGDEAIYVNIDELVILYDLCHQFHPNRTSLIETVVKLELIRVFVHETVLVLIRKSLKDLNESTNPELLLKNQEVEEPGILIELELFGAKIKFYNTCQSSSIDEDYFTRLLESIVNGSSFDHDQTKFIAVEKSRYSKVTLDFDVQDDCVLDL